MRTERILDRRLAQVQFGGAQYASRAGCGNLLVEVRSVILGITGSTRKREHRRNSSGRGRKEPWARERKASDGGH